MTSAAGWRATWFRSPTNGRRGKPLLRPVMRGGRRLFPDLPDLTASRATTPKISWRGFPDRSRGSNPHTYPVEIGASLRELAAELDRRRIADARVIGE